VMEGLPLFFAPAAPATTRARPGMFLKRAAGNLR